MFIVHEAVWGGAGRCGAVRSSGGGSGQCGSGRHEVGCNETARCFNSVQGSLTSFALETFSWTGNMMNGDVMKATESDIKVAQKSRAVEKF